MTRRSEWTAIVAGAAGALACSWLVLRFVLDYRDSALGWKPGISPPELYDALGRHFGRGFLAGFFLCLCLTLVGAGLQSYRAQRSRKPQQP